MTVIIKETTDGESMNFQESHEELITIVNNTNIVLKDVNKFLNRYKKRTQRFIRKYCPEIASASVGTLGIGGSLLAVGVSGTKVGFAYGGLQSGLAAIGLGGGMAGGLAMTGGIVLIPAIITGVSVKFATTSHIKKMLTRYCLILKNHIDELKQYDTSETKDIINVCKLKLIEIYILMLSFNMKMEVPSFMQNGKIEKDLIQYV